ncbi:MAG: hypothetical protein ABI091_26575 [Ferruginibacter sp.]
MRFCEFEKCKYPVFGTDKVTGKGYCRTHQTKRTDLDRRSIIQKAIAKQGRLETKVRSLHSLPANKIMVADKKYTQSNELKLWFYYHMNNSPKVCENCKADLSHYNEKDWYGSQDHIIEKSGLNGCPSVSCVLDNHCVLGKWCCHSQKHTSNFNLSKMAVFPLMKERFSKFGHLISENELKKIPEIFL